MTRPVNDFVEQPLNERLEGVPDAALQSIISREAGVRSHARIDNLSVFQPGSSVDGGQLATFEPGADIDLGAGQDILVLGGTYQQWVLEADPSGVLTVTPVRGWEESDLNYDVRVPDQAATYRGVDAIYFEEGAFDDPHPTYAFYMGDYQAAELARLYSAVFGRAPDAPGLSYWMNERADGMGIKEIAMNFMLSEEFKERYGEDQSNAQFLEILYNNILGRDSDPEGYAYWIDKLDSGENDRKTVLVSFTNSAENVEKTDWYIGDLTDGWQNIHAGIVGDPPLERDEQTFDQPIEGGTVSGTTAPDAITVNNGAIDTRFELGAGDDTFSVQGVYDNLEVDLGSGADIVTVNTIDSAGHLRIENFGHDDVYESHALVLWPDSTGGISLREPGPDRGASPDEIHNNGIVFRLDAGTPATADGVASALSGVTPGSVDPETGNGWQDDFLAVVQSGADTLVFEYAGLKFKSADENENGIADPAEFDHVATLVGVDVNSLSADNFAWHV